MKKAMSDFPHIAPYTEMFIDICHRLYENKYVIAYDGNVSLRFNDYILATPTHINKGDLTEEDLIITNLNGQLIAGKHAATSELKMHLAIYKINTKAQCVIHAHPLYATALYRTDRMVHIDTLMEAGLFFDEVPIIPFQNPGSQQLADEVGEAIGAHGNACVLEKHGVTVCGQTLEETYYLLETLERLAHTEYILQNIQ